MLESRLGRRSTRFVEARDGTVAIEVAVLLLPFVMLIFAVFELALLFLVSASLDSALHKAARQVRTGAFQQEWASSSLEVQEAQFETLICKQVTWLMGDCGEHLEVDVRTFGKDAWVDISDAPNPYDPNTRTFDTTVTTFQAGEGTDIVLVRGWYKWPLIAPFVSQAVARLEGSVALITSTQTFRNEPYR